MMTKLRGKTTELMSELSSETSIEELENLKRAIDAQLTAKKMAKRKAAIEEITKLMLDSNITPFDLAEANPNFRCVVLTVAQHDELKRAERMNKSRLSDAKTLENARRASPVTLKYRNPETGELHSGRGKNPPWLSIAKKQGKADKFLIPEADLPRYNPHLAE